MDTMDENENTIVDNAHEDVSSAFSDDTKLADLTVGQFKHLLADLLAQTQPVSAAPAPETPDEPLETPVAPPEPPRKLSLDELFLDEKPAVQSPVTDTGSGS
jgi:hypothetical protein